MNDFSLARAAPGAQRLLCALDTNVILDWLIFEDPAISTLARMIESNAVELVTTVDCRTELAHVLHYETLRASADDRKRALARFDTFAHIFTGKPRAEILPRCRDATDQKFLELARDAQVDWLITKDRMLLKLASRIRHLGLFAIHTPEQAEIQCQAHQSYRR